MAKPITHSQERLMVCPACRKDITATISVSVELPDGLTASAHMQGWESKADVRLLGIHVEHDCRPAATR